VRLIGVMPGAYWGNGQVWSLFLYLQRVSGLGMDTCEESLTASKANNPIFISGLGPNFALQDQIEELTRQVQQLTVPGGPIIADQEVRRLQQQLKSLEAIFWQKDQQCRLMNRHKMGYIRQIGRLSGIFNEAKDVVGRARAEIHNHAQQMHSWPAHLSCGSWTRMASGRPMLPALPQRSH